MNPVDLLLAAEAVASGRSRPRRVLRHVHVEQNPLAIIALQMAGEPHGLWAALVGDGPGLSRARLLIAPEPRNYDIAFAALGELGAIVCKAIDAHTKGPRERIERKNGPPRTRCASAPQILVASTTAATHLHRLARRMRPAGFGGKKEVPPHVNLAGAHLGFLAESTQEPGSSLLLAATAELSRHFVSGQSDLEDAHLGTQLAWLDPGLLAQVCPDVVAGRDLKKMHGAEAAGFVEGLPMGILTDPETDSEVMVDLVTTFNRRRERSSDPILIAKLTRELEFEQHLRPVLEPIWRAAWVAHRVLLKMKPAPSVEERWGEDRDRFTYHADYVARGGRLASVTSVRRATMQLANREDALTALECAEVLEDPLAMAAALAEGKAIQGEVVSVDLEHREAGKGKSKVNRPLVTMRMEGECPFPVGSELFWTARVAVSAEVHAVTQDQRGNTLMTLKVTAGMRGELPIARTTATFSVFSGGWIPPAPLPKDTPWTHSPSPDATTNDSLELDDGPPHDALVGLETGRDLEAELA